MKSTMKTEMRMVSPSLANRWLTLNRRNRKVRKLHVQRLAKDMAEGRWKVTGEAIAFDTEGSLQNGQHRLLAVVEAGVEVPMLVVRGVSPDAFDVIDQGSVRTTGDALRSLGVSDPVIIAAAARLALLYDLYPDKPWNTAVQSITKTQVTEYAEQHAAALLLAEGASRHWHFGRSRYSAIITGAYLIYRKHGKSEKFTEFSNGLVTGANLPEGSPILALRNYIINSRTGNKTHDRWDAQRMVFAILKAWNYFLEGKDTEYLRVTPSSLPMPDVK